MTTVQEVAEWIEDEFTEALELADWMRENAIRGQRAEAQTCPLSRLMTIRVRQPVYTTLDSWEYVDRVTGHVTHCAMGPVAREFRQRFDALSYPDLVGRP